MLFEEHNNFGEKRLSREIKSAAEVKFQKTRAIDLKELSPAFLFWIFIINRRIFLNNKS